MKKIRIIAALLAVSASVMAQTNWTTDGLHLTGQNAKLGTTNNRSVYLFTNDSTRVIFDSIGTIKVSKFSNPDGGYNAIYAGPNGELTLSSNISNTTVPLLTDLSYGCTAYTKSWYEGGNFIIGSNRNLIGTCNNKDFILKAADKSTVVLKADSTGTNLVGVGEGNTTPTAQLDISDPRVNPATTNAREHTRIYGNDKGGIEASYDMNLYYTNAFNINKGSYSTSSSMLNMNTYGDFSLSKFSVLAGTGQTYMGGNLASNSSMFTVGQSSKAVPALLLTDNTTTTNKDYFKVLGSGYTEINVYSPSTMPNNRALAIRDASNSSSIRDLFVVKSDGKVYAREFEISNVTSFPDYVFSKNYKLRSIDELESYITSNSHLPGFEKGDYYEQNGMKVSELIVKQQEKIEELSLYIIELGKRVKELEKNNK